MIREKNIPVDSVELKDSCVNQLAWEPNGSKFAVVHGEGQHSAVSFYQVSFLCLIVFSCERSLTGTFQNIIRDLYSMFFSLMTVVYG